MHTLFAIPFRDILRKITTTFYCMSIAAYVIVAYMLKGNFTVFLPSEYNLLNLCYILSIIGVANQLSKQRLFSFTGKLCLGLIISRLCSNFIWMTRTVNMADHQFASFYENLFNDHLLFSTILVIVVATVFKVVRYAIAKQLVFPVYYESQSILYGLIGTFTLLDSNYLKNVLRISMKLPKDPALLFWNVLGSLLLFGLIAEIVFRALSHARKNRPSLELAISSSLFFAMVFNYTFQIGIQGDSDLFGYYVFPGATLYQLLILFITCLLIYFIINRYFYTSLLVIVLGTAISFANFVKIEMRSEPLLVTDFAWLKQLNLIFGFIDNRIILYGVAGLIGVFIFIFLFRNRILPGRILKKKHSNIVGIVSIVVLYLFIYNVFANEQNGKIKEGIPVVSAVNNSLNIGYMGNTVNARYKSLMYVWTKQVTKPIMEKPSGYNKEMIQQIVEKYRLRAESINQKRTESLADRTVIFILSESLADPARIPSIQLSKDVLPNINRLITQTTGGLMKSDGYGGGTANMETQSLLGLPLYNLSSGVSVMNTEVIPKMAYFPAISDVYDKKNRFAIHLGDATTYSRQATYSKLGFSTFIAAEGTKNRAKHAEKMGLYPSDEATYKNVLEYLDTGKSQFFSVVTYQNHVPWLYGEPQDVYASSELFSDEKDSELSNYARLLYNTDVSTQAFLDQLSMMDKDISVVFYGDHLPSLYPDSFFKNHPELKYQTEYFIWNNKENQKLPYHYVNSSDFPAALLAHTNSKVSPYYALLTDVLDHASINQDGTKEEAQVIAKDLKMIQYDLTAGENYVLQFKEFFLFK